MIDCVMSDALWQAKSFSHKNFWGSMTEGNGKPNHRSIQHALTEVRPQTVGRFPRTGSFDIVEGFLASGDAL
jgi:hypothetical protein